MKSNATVIIDLAHTNLVDAEPALSHCRIALESGKHVITANKGPVTLNFAEIKKLADDHNSAFLFEATVMSGTPVFSLLKHSLAGNTISEVRGILNGTTNFILSEMETGLSFDEALKLADEHGYLEADRSADIDGHDAQAKLTILANAMLGLPLELADIKREGISSITAQDVKSAQSEGKRWKLIASISMDGEDLIARVRPEKLPLTHPLAHVNGTANAIIFSTDLLGEITIAGPGAGKLETGYSILSDLLTLNKGDFS